IRRSGSIEDYRSTNGTMLNASYLRYGTSARIVDGDFVVIAGYRALQFLTSRPAVANVPAGTWGGFIDHTAPTDHHLREMGYAVTMGVREVLARDDGTRPARLRIRPGEIFDVDDDWRLAVIVPNRDEHERVSGDDFRPVPSGTWIKLSDGLGGQGLLYV